MKYVSFFEYYAVRREHVGVLVLRLSYAPFLSAQYSKIQISYVAHVFILSLKILPVPLT